jgi:hypothetical protein
MWFQDTRPISSLSLEIKTHHNMVHQCEFFQLSDVLSLSIIPQKDIALIDDTSVKDCPN